MENYNEYTPVTINSTYVDSLSEFIHYLNNYGIKHTVRFYMHGFIVTFDGLKGDAILHGGSYGRNTRKWETIGFPWDYNDVSVHSSEQLADLLATYQDGGDWEAIENSENYS